VLQFLHQTPFGVTDPIFGRDLANYVSPLPIVTGVLAILTTLSRCRCSPAARCTRCAATSWLSRTVTIEPSARLHLGLLIVAMFVLTALRIYFVAVARHAVLDHRSAVRRELRRSARQAHGPADRGRGRDP